MDIVKYLNQIIKFGDIYVYMSLAIKVSLLYKKTN